MFAVEEAPGPSLVTERLRLRPIRRTDLDPLDEAIRETLSELVKWLPWAHPSRTRTDTRRYIRQARIARARGTAYEFIVMHEATEQVLGVMGLHRVDWSRRSAGLGYWIRRSAWGHGFAPESAACVVEHAFRSLGLNRLEAHVALDNHGSQRVVEKLGFQREGVARELEIIGGRPLDHIQYGLLRREVVGVEDLA